MPSPPSSRLPALDDLLACSTQPRLPRARADGARRRDRLRRARVARPSCPIGWTDRQDAGTYRLERRDDEARFGYAVGPHSWKRFLFPPRVRLWRARAERRRAGDRGGAARRDAARVPRRSRLRAARDRDPGPRLPRRPHVDRDYAARRDGAFLVAVNCFEPGGTCFCASMGTGPKVEAGYDLALTELLDGEHRFLVEAGSERGRRGARRAARRGRPTTDDLGGRGRVGRRRPRRGWGARWRPATSATCSRATSSTRAGTTSPSAASPAATARSSARPASARPVEDETDLAGDEAERWRVWDTCFSRRLLVHPRRQRPALGPLALPAVDDPQARHVARPVRLVGLRRLRPLHHVVPGRDRHHRGGRRDPRDEETNDAAAA